jgi:hypothetical protein
MPTTLPPPTHENPEKPQNSNQNRKFEEAAGAAAPPR